MGPLAVEELPEANYIAERLKQLDLDPSFVVDAEHRAQFGANPDEDDIPVLDLSPFRRICDLEGHASLGRALEDDSSLQELVSAVGRACEKWGFFQVVNHGVPLSLLDNLEKVAQQFFDLPLAEKRKSRRTFSRYLGYYESELTKNKRDWKEVFDFACRGSMESPKEVDGDRASEETIKCENQWPEDPPELRPVCEEWSAAVESLASDLLGLISLSLGLPFSHFSHHFQENTNLIRLNYYPKCPIPDLALGVSRHKDSGALTVLVQDEVGGLQVRRKDGEWISVKPRRDAFVINVGDLFQVWTNDKYHSVEHRVVVNENRHRFSFPLFYNPSCKTDVFPVPELVDEEHPPKYRTYNWGMFFTTRNNGNYKQLGENIQIHHFGVDT